MQRSLWIVMLCLNFQLQAQPASISIAQFKVNGSGCPAGSVVESLSEDGQSVTLYFSDYLAELGPMVPAPLKRRACQLTFNIEHSPGWRFGLVEFKYRGMLVLDEGVEGQHRSEYYLQGEPESLSFATKIEGPRDGQFAIAESLVPSEVYWSSCDTNRAVNIKTSLRLRRGPGADTAAGGVFGTDSLDANLSSQEYRLAWERCAAQ